MNWIMYFIMFILGAISMFMMVCMGYAAKQEEPVNKVHFYVQKYSCGYDLVIKSKKQKLYLICTSLFFQAFNLDIKDFADMKEGEIREVFINMED